MIFMGLVTFNQEHCQNVKEAELLTLVFLNKINIGGYRSLPVSFDDSDMQEEFEKTRIFEQFISKPENPNYQPEEESVGNYGGEYGKLCDYLGWWCCSPSEIGEITSGSSEFMKNYENGCELFGEPVRIIDLDMDSVDLSNIDKKFATVVKFHC